MEDVAGRTSLIPTLCGFYSQFKKAELLKKLPNARVSTDPKINNLQKLISNLRLNEGSSSRKSDVFDTLDITVRAVISSINERISCLWNYRDEETKLLNILTLCRDISLMVVSLQSVQKVIGKDSSYFASYVEECLRRILPRCQKRVDHMLSQYTEDLVTRVVMDYLQQSPQYFCESPKNSAAPLQLCCSSYGDTISPDRRPPGSHDDLTALLANATISSFKEAKTALTSSPSSSFDVSRSYRLFIEHSLNAILIAFLAHTITLDESGLERLHRLFLFYKQLGCNGDVDLSVQSFQTIPTWQKAKAVFELVKGFIYQTSTQGKLPLSETGAVLSLDEVLRWKGLVRSKSSTMFSGRKKKKASVFVAMELD